MKRLIPIVFSAVFLSSCIKDGQNRCEYDPCGLFAPAAEVTAVEDYLDANSITATKHCGGYYYIIDAAGSGVSATICSTVSVKYKGQLSDGTVFDNVTTPVNYQLSILIESWRKAMMQIKPGGKIRMWVPPSLAYGSQEIKDNNGNVIIPANSMLIFEIELVSVL